MKNSLWPIFALPLVSAAILTARNASVVCNNSPDLCNRPYSSIAHLGAHDSPFLRDASTGYSNSGNQYLNTTAQLDGGVRLLSAQVHNANGAWHLCHTSCSLLDAGTLTSWLGEIKAWMDQNPHDVVTLLLVNSDNASAQDLHTEFQASGIVPYGYVPPSSTAAFATWPTLNELIAKSTRLITLVASLPPSSNTIAPYLLDEFTFVFENPYDVTSLSNFSCTPDRPPAVRGDIKSAVASGRLPLMNHFLYQQQAFGIELPDVSNITKTNAQRGPVGNLGDTAKACQTLYGKPPTFILVDFFDQGPAIDTVDSLNGIIPVGRVRATATGLQMSTSTSGSGRHNLRDVLTRCSSGLIVVGIIFVML